MTTRVKPKKYLNGVADGKLGETAGQNARHCVLLDVGTPEKPFTSRKPFVSLPAMLKRMLPYLFAPLLLAGCTSTFTNLTPLHQTRNANNLYPVEVAMTSRQQTLRWDTIHPQIMVGDELYPMRPTNLMTNRWEGLVPVPPGTSLVHYRYKFDFDYTSMGKSKPDSALSPEYTLQISEP